LVIKISKCFPNHTAAEDDFSTFFAAAYNLAVTSGNTNIRIVIVERFFMIHYLFIHYLSAGTGIFGNSTDSYVADVPEI